METAGSGGTFGRAQGYWHRFATWPWAVVALALLATVMWPLVRVVALQRVVAFELQRTAPSGLWSLEWLRAKATIANGVWLDLPTASSSQQSVSPTSAPAAPDHVVLRLPGYSLARLELRWKDYSSAGFVLEQPALIEVVYGLPVLRRLLTPEPGEGIQLDATHGAYQVSNAPPAGALRFRGRTHVRAAAHAVGYGITFAGLVALYGLIRLACACMRRLRWRPDYWSAVAIAVIALIRVWVGGWAPLFASWDGIQYLSGSQVLLQTGSLDHFDAFRMPGYSILAVPALLLSRFDIALLLMQGLFGFVAAVCVWDILRRFLPMPWPALGALYAGCDPILIAYEHHALTEAASTFAVAVSTWLLIRLWTPPEQPRRSVAWHLRGAAALGLACGLAPYVRSNLLVLPLLLPLPLLILGWARRRLVLACGQSALVVLMAAACVLPWVWRNQQKYGHAVFAVGRELQRNASYWDSDALDLNQTRAYTQEQWQGIRAAGYFPHVRLWPILLAFDLPAARGQDLFFAQEARAKVLNDEAAARRPLNVLHGMLVAFGNQTGLWTKVTQHFGRENLRWSKPLRGEVGGNWESNLYDHETTADRGTAMRERLASIERSVRHLALDANALTFNDLYFGYELTRPIVALLFLIGAVLALSARCWPAATVALLAGVHFLAISILLGSAVDRYSVPYKPLMAIVATYAVYQLLDWRKARRSAPAA